MIRFACPGCSATFTVTDEKAGKTGKCPKCQTQFTIPAPAVDELIIPPPHPVVEPPPPITTVEPPPPPPPPVEAPPPMPPAVEAPPPMHVPPPVAPTPPGPNDPVEIVPCPKCSSRLSVLPGDVGLDVECPNCQTVYRANRADAPPPPALDDKPRTSTLVKYGSGAKGKRDDDEDEDDDRPSRRKKSRRNNDDDDDDDDDRPSRRRKSRVRRRSGRNYEAHRGVLVLVLGIIAIASTFIGLWGVNLICGIIAWVLGSMDIKAMDAGRMDPEGKSQTQIGMYLGMATVILTVVSLLAICVIYGCFFGGMLAIFAGAK